MTAKDRVEASAGSAVEQVHQFGKLGALIVLVATGDRALDAMRHMVLEHLVLDAPQGRPGGMDLRKDVYAVALLLDHAGDAADLPLDPAQPLEAIRVDSMFHALTYTPRGY